MSYERIPFKLIVCPECSHALCWVNPRVPTYCPACGKNIFARIKESIRFSDDNAELKLEGEVKWASGN